jgi:ribosomal protein S6
MSRQWVMTFDANPQTLLELNQQLKLDPMVIRHGVISMGSKLADKVPPLVSRDEVYASLVRQKTDY